MIPTEEGYYWCHYTEGEDEWHIVYIMKWRFGLDVYLPGDDTTYKLSEFCSWIGPLIPPDKQPHPHEICGEMPYCTWLLDEDGNEIKPLQPPDGKEME